MLYDIAVIIYIASISVFVIRQQLILLGGYILAREKDGVSLGDKLLLDTFIKMGTKNVALSILFLVGLIIIFVLNLF